MTIILIALHIIVCILLIGIILIQAGRGGGLVDSFAGVESMFGTKTNSFLTRSTTVLSIIFFVTCIVLALLSARQGKSLMRGRKPAAEKAAVSQPEQQQPAPPAPEASEAKEAAD